MTRVDATPRRVLGIDPGSRITGYGLIESDGRRSRHLASGCIRLVEEDYIQRIGELYRRLRALVQEMDAQVAAIEQVFAGKNVLSMLKLGQARGAALCVLAETGIAVFEYSPKSVKQAVVGRGGADKTQVQHMVKALLSLPKQPQADEADALAVALCHAHSLMGAGALLRGVK